MASKTPNNFEVYARLRASEARTDAPLQISGDILQQREQTAAFKKVFQPDASNSQVFEAAVQPNVDRVFQGYNSHVLCYGGNAAGKSYTILGDEKNPGVASLTATRIFKAVEESKKQKFLVTLSMYQLQSSFSKSRNREFITDLINPDTSKTLTIADYRDSVDDIAEIVVRSPEQLVMYMNQGWAVHRLLAQRSAAEKGHVVIDIRVESTDKDDPFRITYATLRFVVFAAANGKATEYNSGLKEFTNVINSRVSNVSELEIQYSASKLTQLLQPSLSSLRANAFGTFLLCLATGQDSADMIGLAGKIQSLSTASKINFNTITSAIKELREEIRRRRDEMKLDNPTTYIQDVKAENIQTLQRLIVELERVKSQTWKIRRDNSAAVLRQRVARLKTEGLSGILVESNVEIPTEMKKDAREKLRALIVKHNALRAQEDKVETARHKYQTLAARKVKADANADVIEKARAVVEKQQQQMRQEELMLNKVISQYNTTFGDYTAAQRKVLQLETKKSKVFLFPEDAAAVQRAKDQEIWAEMKAERDQLLSSEYSAQEARSAAVTKDIEGANDVDSCKKLLASLADSLQQKEIRVKELEVDKDLIISSLYHKDAAQENQMQRFQEHMFFVFRNYRSHFEEQKTRIELRYRDLLENSVKDALKLQEENNRLRSELLKKSAM